MTDTQTIEHAPIAGQASDDQHCMTCTSHGSNGKISTPSLSTDATLKLIVQPAPAAAGSGLDLYEELNVHRDHGQVTEAWHQDWWSDFNSTHRRISAFCCAALLL